MKEYGSVLVEGALSTIHQNYYAQLCKLDEWGVGLGGGFDHTSELKVMKFKEAMNGPGSDQWKEEI